MKNEILKHIPDKAYWFDAAVVNGQSTPILFKNNRLHSVNEKENSGIGIRVNVDRKTGFSYTNDTDEIGGAVKRAAEVSKFSDEESFVLPGNVPDVDVKAYDEGIKKFDISDEIEKAQTIISRLNKKYNGITVDLSVYALNGYFRLLNSSGFDSEYVNSEYSASLSTTYIPDRGDKIDTWQSRVALSPVNYEDIVERLSFKIDSALNGAVLSSGKYPLFLPPSAFMRFLGMMLSGLNAVSVWKGISPLGEKLSQKCFNDSISIYDDPLLQGSPDSCPFDGEGMISCKKELIKNGIVRNFISDLKYAEKIGMDMSGNASRGYSTLPAPGFSNIVVDGGSDSKNVLITTIKRGIWAEQFIGLGQSNSLSGDFSANLDLAYLIEDGEIKGRLKDCMISGNIYNLLEGNLMLSNERENVGTSLAPYAVFEKIDFTS